LAIASPLWRPRRIVIASISGRRHATSSKAINSASVSARRLRRQSALVSAFVTAAKGLVKSRRVRTHQLPKLTNSCRYSLRVPALIPSACRSASQRSRAEAVSAERHRKPHSSVSLVSRFSEFFTRTRFNPFAIWWAM
jgi:hypothetical protein